MKKIKCITLYPEVYSNKNLTPNEKIYLSVIRYYTIEGRTHCCKFCDSEMAEELEINVKIIRNIKCKLKKLGLITILDNGIEYNTPSLKNDETSLNNDKVSLNNDNSSLNNYEKFYKYIENQQVARVNKENKEENKKNKDNKPEEKFETNFDLIFSKVKEIFRTEENKTYLIDNFKDKVDYFNNLSRKDLNEDLGSIVDSVNSALSQKNSFEAIKNIEENKERFLIEKKKEIDLGEVF